MKAAPVFVGTSVDGFIARVNGELDLLPHDGGEPRTAMTSSWPRSMRSSSGATPSRPCSDSIPGPMAQARLRAQHWPRLPASEGGGGRAHVGPAAEIVPRLGRAASVMSMWTAGSPFQRFLRAGLIQNHDHSRSRAHRNRDSAVRRLAARRRPQTRRHTAVRQRPRPERVRGHGLTMAHSEDQALPTSASGSSPAPPKGPRSAIGPSAWKGQSYSAPMTIPRSRCTRTRSPST